MVPIRLEITDFLSYKGTHVLDFSGFQVASIVGVNGAGKSAILDALTWALFSKSRMPTKLGTATSSVIDRAKIINDNATKCEVVFEFEVDGNRYMIDRVMEKTDKGSEIGVQFKQLTQDCEHNLKGKSTTDTDKEIEKEIGFTYDVFVSSSFITQGDSSRFMDAKPSDRRAILAQILELDKYERCEDKASEELKKVRDQIKEIKARLEEKLIVVSSLDQLESDLTVFQKTFEEKECAWNKAQEEVVSLQKRLSALEGEESLLIEKKTRLDVVSKDKDLLEKSIQKTQEDIKKFEKIVKDQDAIIEGFTKLQKAKTSLEMIQKIADDFENLEKERIYIESLIKEEKTRLEFSLNQTQKEFTESVNAASQIGRLEEEKKLFDEKRAKAQFASKEKDKLEADLKITKASLADAVKNYDKTSSILDQQLKKLNLSTNDEVLEELSGASLARQKITESEETLTTLQIQEKELIEEKTTIKSNIAHIEQELILFSEGTTGTCPLCGQELPEGGSVELIKNKELELKNLKAEFDNVGISIKKCQGLIDKSEGDIKSLKAKLDRIAFLEQADAQFKELQSQMASLKENEERHNQADKLLSNFVLENAKLFGDFAEIEKSFLAVSSKLDEAKGKASKLILLKTQILELETSIKTNNYKLEERSKLQRIAKSIADLKYDKDLLQNARKEVKNFEHFERESRDLEVAKANLESANAKLSTDNQRIEATAKEEQELNSQLIKLPGIESAKNDLTEKIKVAKSSEQTAKKSRDESKTQLDTTFEKVKEAKNIKVETETMQIKAGQLVEEQKILEYCKQMFSMEGIPSHILEGVVPQLAEVSNSVLERITSGHPGSDSMRMEIKLEREGGKVSKSTLDIILTDDQIKRPYELFSGGERFRADFAIRIGLSKLLASRAGAKLRTLVIDEGFGTQDSIGIQNLVEAINEISNDFDKVLVVSHVEEMKNSFESKIVVDRDESGSHFQVM